MDRKSETFTNLTLSHKPNQNLLSRQTDPDSENTFPDQFRLGLLTFKPGISQKNLQKILKNKKQTIFSKKSWVFKSCQLSEEKETQFYSHIDQLAISQLEYRQTKFNNILKMVQHIDFKNLRRLSLPCNFITNIEALGYLGIQNVEYIDLGGNYICQSKSLIKLNLSNLGYLEVCDNRLFELKISRIRNQKGKIYPRLITFPSQTVFQQISFLAKLQHNVVSCIMEFDLMYYSGQSRYGFSFDRNKTQNKLILQQKVSQCLKKKLKFQAE